MESVEEHLFPPLSDELDPFGTVSEQALAGDLRVLMRGPGAQPGQDMSRIGSALRTMCGIASSDSPADAIDAVSAWLRPRIASLGSEEQRMCALLVFGLHETAQVPDARMRATMAADYLGRSYLTARRHAVAAAMTIARTTSPSESVPLQLRRLAGGWVRLGVSRDRNDKSHEESYDVSANVLAARCFLITVASPVDQLGKVYAIVRFGTNRRVATAIPAVRVRHVRPAPLADSGALDVGDHER